MMDYPASLYKPHLLKERSIDKDRSFSDEGCLFEFTTTIEVETSYNIPWTGGSDYFNLVASMNNIYWNLITNTEEFNSWK